MKDRVYLVSGGAGGIGSAIVGKIVENIKQGVIIVHYKDNRMVAQGLKKKYETSKIKIDILQADFEEQSQLEVFCDKILSNYGHVDVLVNNASFYDEKEIFERSYEDFEKTVKINLLAPFYLSKVFGQKMVENKFGKIVNISSENGLILYSGCFNPTSIDYDVTKAGLNVLTKNFAKEFAPFVNVNAVAPGWVETPMSSGMTDEDKKISENKILKNRWAKPEEIAELVWYLISDKSDFINGSIYEIDGGNK